MSCRALVRALTIVCCCLSSVCGLASIVISCVTIESVSRPEVIPVNVIVPAISGSAVDVVGWGGRLRRAVAVERAATAAQPREEAGQLGQRPLRRPLVAGPSALHLGQQRRVGGSQRRGLRQQAGSLL